MTTPRARRRSEIRLTSPDDIAHRAYELFETRGWEPGHDLDDWLQAERELCSRPPSTSAERRHVSRPDDDGR